MITKLVSGGQTGADIAALDVALRHGFPHGGWCPKGRRSLGGPAWCDCGARPASPPILSRLATPEPAAIPFDPQVILPTPD